ncbi:MAG: magnesium transporter CorA family protein [Candidatus Paceibacterota bacterium]
MIKEYTHGDITWVDLTKPTQDEVRTAMKRFDLPPAIAQELLSPSAKPKIDVYGDNFYLILHFPAIKHAGQEESIQELDFIVSKDTVITTRYDSIDPVHKFTKEFKISSILKNNLAPEGQKEHAGHLFFAMLSELYETLAADLAYIETSLDEIEEKIFAGKEKDMVREISNVSRILLTFRQSLITHSGILQSLKEVSDDLFGENYDLYINELINEHFRVSRTVEQLQDIVKEVRETNHALLSTKQNEVMKTLTIMAFVTFPLSLLASIFGMNTVHTPVAGMENDFWIVIVIMGILTLAFFIFFKQKKWL